MRVLLTVFTLNVLSLCCFAQLPGLHINKATAPIIIDGLMNESDWAQADVADHFKQYFPFDSSYARTKTEVRMTYDDHAIYIFAIMYNLGPRKYVTTSLRRDFNGGFIDAFNIILDTYQDRTNAFLFGITPYGVQREGLISNGGQGSDDLVFSWDNKWISHARIEEDRWVAEIAIPFKTLRYKHGLQAWNLNFYRTDSEYTERAIWSPLSRAYPSINLSSMRELLWDRPLSHPGGNVTIIPYVAGSSQRNFEAGTAADTKPDVGGDAKIGIGPALNLDITVNPDFSQVEVDQQVTNLTRFEIYYPEKRQFFLENGDLFSNFGYSNMRPFFSRRIGVTRDPSTGQNIQNKIYAGMRVSGKINNNWRVGLMSMQAARDKNVSLPSINYTVAAVQRKIFKRSNIGAIFINKQPVGSIDSNTSKFNRVAGVDFNLATLNNRWTGKAFYHRSLSEHNNNGAFAASGQLTYQVPSLEVNFLAQQVGANYNPETGYTPRTRFKHVLPEIYYNFYPRSRLINNHGPGADMEITWTDFAKTTDWSTSFWYRISFQNSSTFFIRLKRDYGKAYFAFDPSFPADAAQAINLPVGSTYFWNSATLNYQSNARKKLFAGLQSQVGQYYNGTRVNADATVTLRFQPYVLFSMNASYNRVRLPAPYKSANLVLVGPKFDVTFLKNLFWTTYIQYNNQIQNMNINSRLQLRFKPVSDIFLVYTDNYQAEAFQHSDALYLGQPKLRAFVLKMTWWLNL